MFSYWFYKIFGKVQDKVTDLLVHLVQGGLGDVESLNIGQVVGPEHQVR